MIRYRLPLRSPLLQLLVGAAIVAFLWALLMPMVVRAREQANLLRCRDNLRQLGQGLLAYAATENGALPVSPTIENPQTDLLQALRAHGAAGNPAAFYCPSEPDARLRYAPDRFATGTIDYFYYSAISCGPDPRLSKFLKTMLSWPRCLNTSLPPRTWVMSDRWTSGDATNHAGYRKGVNYLALDGSVSFVSESPRRTFQ